MLHIATNASLYHLADNEIRQEAKGSVQKVNELRDLKTEFESRTARKADRTGLRWTSN